jgi:outer membrane protein TolC
MVRICSCLAVVALLAVGPANAQDPAATRVSTRIVGSIEEPDLRELIAEVLERNPGVAAAEAAARAAGRRAPQVRALPDPTVSLTAFLETPETRTGPQRFAAGISQGLPWPGRLALKEQAASYAAAALAADVEATRLAVLTEARRLYLELGFLARYRAITEELRLHLEQHEEIARARYATGAGLGQDVLKLQAEITRAERTLLEIDARRAALEAQLNGLRDAPASALLPAGRLPDVQERPLAFDILLARALELRPEIAAADVRISRAATLIQLAEKGYRPDFKVGLTYTLVDRREDAAGRAQPPQGNGDDILGIQGGITLPIWRKKLAAGVEEAEQLQLAAEEAKRGLIAMIRAAVGDLTQTVPLNWRELRLVDDLLMVQAEEALESAQAAYVSGTLNALDLLDAEHVLFEAQTATARAKADYLIGLARLEGAVGEPLQDISAMERSDS